MNSRREYRDAPSYDIKIPREVFYRCLWTIKDIRRLAEIARLSREPKVGEAFIRYLSSEDEARSAADDQTILVSEEIAGQACYDLKCIGAALSRIPEVYRKGLLDNIIDKTPFNDFAHTNTWKRWKLVLIYELARELHLI